MILAGLFILLVIIIAWFALDRVKERIQADMSDALQIVLHTTQESLNLWVESNKLQLIRIAEDPRLVSLTELQLRVPRNKTSLSESTPLKELRAFFRNEKDQFGQSRFLIISPDFINIASMRDEKIGAKNLMANQALDLLNRAFRGKTVMVPPIWSDIPLITPLVGKNKKTASMFFAAPIKNKQERVIAVVAQRVDPSIDFTRLIQLGRIGKSGETYAFGQYGKLLSESRFDDDLVNAGMLDKGETSILAVSVRDPGGDMTKGFTPSVPRYQQPLTLMAQQATKGKAGLNVEGYRDYRGVRVYGAWLWDDKLGIGLTTEIDEADALGPYYTTRTVILTVLGITALLALGSLIFAVVIEQRAGRALQKSHDELEIRVEERTAELKENQTRLEQVEERSRLLLESAQEGIFGVAEDGLVNFINPAGLAMLGFETDELIGQKIHPLIHHTRPDGTPFPIEECPMHRSLAQGTIGSRDDEVLWRKDGTSFHVEYTSVPIRKNDSISGTVVVFRDISERKQAEEALRESEINMRTIFENSPLGMIHFSKEGTILDCNDMFVELMGSSREKLIGFNTAKQTNDERLRAAIIKALAGETAEYEGDYTSVTGNKTTALRIVFNPTEPGTSPTEVIATLEDITERKEAEEALRESRATARGLLDATQESLLLLDKEGIIIAVNETAARRHQKTPDELVGTNRFDLFPQDLRESRKAHFNNVLQTGKPADFEDIRDGMVLHHIYYPVQDKTGAIIGVAIFAQDITERKLAEEAIRESQERLSTILKTTNQGFWLVDNDTVTLDVNDAMCEILDRTKADIIGKKIYDFLDEESKAKVREQEEVRTESKRSLYEVSLIRFDGKQVPCLVNASPLLDGDGCKIGSFGMFTDITDRKAAEEAIRESRERLNTILKTTAQGFWLNDQDENIMEINDAMCEILGLTKEEIVGSNFFNFLDEKNREIVREQNRMRKKGIHSMYEISLIRADGRQVPCLMNASPLLDSDGKVVGSFGMTTNIAERKLMEEELRRNVDELERFSKVAYGREKKMIQLKQEINELMMQSGKAEKYKIVE